LSIHFNISPLKFGEKWRITYCTLSASILEKLPMWPICWQPIGTHFLLSRLPTRTHLINTPQPQRCLSVGIITTTPSHGQQLRERRGIGALGALVTPPRHRKLSAPSSSLPALPLAPPQRSWMSRLLHRPSLYRLNRERPYLSCKRKTRSTKRI
jgi:hypothetical protein